MFTKEKTPRHQQWRISSHYSFPSAGMPSRCISPNHKATMMLHISTTFSQTSCTTRSKSIQIFNLGKQRGKRSVIVQCSNHAEDPNVVKNWLNFLPQTTSGACTDGLQPLEERLMHYHTFCQVGSIDNTNNLEINALEYPRKYLKNNEAMERRQDLVPARRRQWQWQWQSAAETALCI